jgi:hypothetical protein
MYWGLKLVHLISCSSRNFSMILHPLSLLVCKGQGWRAKIMGKGGEVGVEDKGGGHGWRVRVERWKDKGGGEGVTRRNDPR